MQASHPSCVPAFQSLSYVLILLLPLLVTTDPSCYDYSPLPITPESAFVTTNGTEFALNSEPFCFVGTNAWYLGQPDKMTDAEVEEFFFLAGRFGLKVVRYFAFSNGCGRGTKTPEPVQLQLGIWNERALQRIDLILREAGKNGVRVLMNLSNFEPFLGGWQWWVDQVLGAGYPLEIFMIDDDVKCAWRSFVEMVLTRNNSYTGVAYRDDPTIFAIELANEPHTNALYESSHQLMPGRLALGWLGEMSAFIRSVDKNHMITTGEEGYRSDGPTDCCLGNQWLNGGFKNMMHAGDILSTLTQSFHAQGVDFVQNVALENISFATVHFYPDNWMIEPINLDWSVASFLDDRAFIAQKAGKPIIMEVVTGDCSVCAFYQMWRNAHLYAPDEMLVQEFGMKTGYLPSRDAMLSKVGFAAVEAGYSGMMVWQLYFTNLEYQSPTDYNFRVGEPGTSAIKSLVSWSWAA